jgi:NAD(P)-dependent dehydrogenase (short-subunit alcohol dehydrogenase family)
MTDVFGLGGKAALVVGGASGIGRATALMLGRVGANVAVADIDAEGAHAVADEVAQLGVETTSVVGDVTTSEGAHNVVSGARTNLDGLDVVVNIVGIATWGDLLDIDVEGWDLEFRRNLTHHLLVGQAAARCMIADGVDGRIACVASVSGLYGAPHHSGYGAAKAGVMALVKSMANEWSRYGIRVNAVAPATIATPRVLIGYERRGITNLDEMATEQGTPLGRYGTPDEIAGALVFLVSDLAGFITGQTIVVDGGMNVRWPHSSRPSTSYA